MTPALNVTCLALLFDPSAISLLKSVISFVRSVISPSHCVAYFFSKSQSCFRISMSSVVEGFSLFFERILSRIFWISVLLDFMSERSLVTFEFEAFWLFSIDNFLVNDGISKLIGLWLSMLGLLFIKFMLLLWVCGYSSTSFLSEFETCFPL